MDQRLTGGDAATVLAEDPAVENSDAPAPAETADPGEDELLDGYQPL